MAYGTVVYGTTVYGSSAGSSGGAWSSLGIVSTHTAERMLTCS